MSTLVLRYGVCLETYNIMYVPFALALSELLDRWDFLWVLCGSSDAEPVEACAELVEGGSPATGSGQAGER
jgi:hypothetical protein